MLILLFFSTMENGGCSLVRRRINTTRLHFTQPTIPLPIGLNILPAQSSPVINQSLGPAAVCWITTAGFSVLPRIVIPHTANRFGLLRSPNLQQPPIKNTRSKSRPSLYPTVAHGMLRACTTLTPIV